VCLCLHRYVLCIACFPSTIPSSLELQVLHGCTFLRCQAAWPSYYLHGCRYWWMICTLLFCYHLLLTFIHLPSASFLLPLYAFWSAACCILCLCLIQCNTLYILYWYWSWRCHVIWEMGDCWWCLCLLPCSELIVLLHQCCLYIPSVLLYHTGGTLDTIIDATVMLPLEGHYITIPLYLLPSVPALYLFSTACPSNGGICIWCMYMPSTFWLHAVYILLCSVYLSSIYIWSCSHVLCLPCGTVVVAIVGVIVLHVLIMPAFWLYAYLLPAIYICTSWVCVLRCDVYCFWNYFLLLCYVCCILYIFCVFPSYTIVQLKHITTLCAFPS